MALSRAEKTDHPTNPFSLNRTRRDFLIRCCQSIPAALAAPALRNFALASAQVDRDPHDGRLHLHPHYRAKLPLEGILLKTEPGLDQFISEKYARQIETILAQWSAGVRRSPDDLQAIETSLANHFFGTSWKPIERRTAREDVGLQIWQNRFAEAPALGGASFLRELKSTLSIFNEISTAEFQVTSLEIAAEDATSIRTLVRYEIVGTGRDFYHEQRVGEWDLEWESAKDAIENYRVRSWRALRETQGRATEPFFVDIAAQAFAHNDSYPQQLLRGTDYWRTVLDQACGIDIYGHNGVAVGDIDGDGFDDLYICQPAGLPNRLYRNRGDGTFEDITADSGLGILENSACALFADFDNDGRQDLIVVRTDGPVLYSNEGSGKFRKRPDAFRFAQAPQGTFTGAAAADYDRDGWLDVYFCLYLYYQGAEQYKYPLPYFDANNGPPNFLMRNQRDGTFRDVTAEAGLNQNNTRYSFCCGWSDYNGDGWPDLYVVNDFGRKNLYRNNGNRTFTDVAAEAGVEDVGAGMGVCWFDYDNDGAEDLYVANMWTAAGERITGQKNFQPDAPETARALYRKHSMGNSLFRGEKSTSQNSPTFKNAGAKAKVEMGRWSWSSDAWDFDHDGFADLYVVNGMISGPSRDDLNSFFWRQVVANSPAQPRPSQEYEQGWNALNELIRADGTWSGYERNVFYANNRDGSFSDVSGVVGMDFLDDGRAFALTDFDHDGRLEVLLKNRNGPQVRLLKNVVKDLPPAIAFRLRGTKSNRDAIGAAVTIQTESSRQTRMLQAGSGFLSQHTKDVFFGLGNAKGTVHATIRWPSGLVQELRDLPANHRIWVEEGVAPKRVEAFAAARTQISAAPAHRPEEIPGIVETWLLVPMEAPNFSLVDIDGRTHALSSTRGKALLLHFWAANSADCRKDLEIMERQHASWVSQGLQLLSINCDEPSDPAKLVRLVREQRLSFPVLRGDEDAVGFYNILYRYLFERHRDLSLPTSFLINDQGEIVKVYQGPINAEHVQEDFQHIPQTAAERLAKALPFPGVTDSTEFQRNHLSYGSIFFQREYFGQAETSFRLAARDDPSSAEAMYGLGSVYLKQNQRSEARGAFQSATKLRANYPETLPNAWNNLGLIATQEGNTQEAIRYFQEAVRVSPQHVIALDNLGNAYRQLKQWDDARSAFEQALAVSVRDAEGNYGLGMVYAQNNDTDRAYEFLQKALQARPGYPEALNNLGVLYLRTGRRDQAVASFEESIRVAPGFDQAYLNLARVHALEGNRGKAREVLRELLKQHPDHALAQKALGELGQ
jgi:Flp pilus assembly protein TadD/peroxiredoxin